MFLVAEGFRGLRLVAFATVLTQIDDLTGLWLRVGSGVRFVGRVVGGRIVVVRRVESIEEVADVCHPIEDLGVEQLGDLGIRDLVPGARRRDPRLLTSA